VPLEEVFADRDVLHRDEAAALLAGSDGVNQERRIAIGEAVQERLEIYGQ
jgi:hypothetical protein